LAYLNLGKALVAEQKYAQAIECYSRLVLIAPNSALAHFDLGNLLFILKRFSEAIEYFQTTIGMTPAFGAAY